MSTFYQIADFRLSEIHIDDLNKMRDEIDHELCLRHQEKIKNLKANFHEALKACLEAGIDIEVYGDDEDGNEVELELLENNYHCYS